ncbi:Nfx1-type zinc finger-containing protein [Aureococcus anophagefferens]|nr:Nfx1-type zinc finger-containing protein [Aureococcus anophagefferens]
MQAAPAHAAAARAGPRRAADPWPRGKKTGGGGGAGAAAAATPSAPRSAAVALKKAEKYGFIKREAPAERGERPLYFRFEDCDCDASRLRENDDVTFAASDAPDDGKFGKRAFHVELDLVRTTEADPGRYGHVDSVLTNLRVHDGAAVERAGSRLAACDVTEATRWAVGLADRGADGVVLRQDEVLDALRRDDWPLVGVAAFLRALADPELVELAQAGAGPVYDACLASPLLLSPKMARALLLKAGTEKRPPKGKPPGKSQGASPDDAAAVGAVAGVVSACLDRDRSAYVALADLLLALEDLVADRRRDKAPAWREALGAAKRVVDRGASLRADAARLDDAAGGDDYRYLKLFPSRDDVLGDGGDDLAPNQVSGSQTAECYVRTHFKLLRADFVGPLRDGVRAARRGEASRDVDVYRDARLVGVAPSRSGLLSVLECDAGREPWRKTRWSRAGDAMNKSRLMGGGLVVVVDAATLGDRAWTCGVVAETRCDKGKLRVHARLDDDGEALVFGGAYAVIDCCATYFEAYRWVLASLQSLDLEAFSSNGLLRTLLELPKTSPRPTYLRRGQSYDLRVDGAAARVEDVLDDASWPATLGTLDACRSSTRSSTGSRGRSPSSRARRARARRTWASPSRATCCSTARGRGGKPLLVVCYTNHALDAFLEGVLEFEPNVIRVGGRSKSEKLADHNLRDKAAELRELDKKCSDGSMFGAVHVRARRSLLARLRELEETAARLAEDAREAATRGPGVDDLEDLATPRQLRSLYGRPVDGCVFEAWLGLDRLDRDVDAEALRGARVIGLTTTAVAKRRELLAVVEPEVVVVEEAAEVLEAHVLAALGRHTRQLVLIGDHEQLRPGTAVFRLATRYNLDVSLFERLVKNGVDHVTLASQRRMRPNISRLVRSIYPKLADHPSTGDLPLVRGVARNVFFLDHAMAEQGDASKSKSNAGEAALVARLAEYLVLGAPRYGPDRVTVLATYVAQVGLLKRSLAARGLDDVRVSSVDNFQGEENDVILLSLVRNDGRGANATKRDRGGATVGFLAVSNRACVSLTRARSGLFVFGNASLLGAKSDLWRSILADLRASGDVGPALPLKPGFRDGDDAVVKVAKDRDFDGLRGAPTPPPPPPPGFA